MRRRLIPYAAALWNHFGVRLLDVPQLTEEEVEAMTRAIDDLQLREAAARAKAMQR